MKVRNQNGFSAIETMVVMVVLAAIIGAVVYVMNKNKSENDVTQPQQTSQNNREQSSDEAGPKLQNLGLASLDSINVTKEALREYSTSGHKGMYVFGEKLPGTPTRLNPNIEYASLKEGTEVVSAIDGEVVFIKSQADSSDSEVFIATSGNSKWIIGYDHLVNLKAKKGDKVKAGDVIGSPARQGNGLLRFEFQVNRKGNSDDIHVCPSTLLDTSKKDEITSKLKEVQQAWISTSGITNLYDITAQNPVGCMSKELTPAQAEGRN